MGRRAPQAGLALAFALVALAGCGSSNSAAEKQAKQLAKAYITPLAGKLTAAERRSYESMLEQAKLHSDERQVGYDAASAFISTWVHTRYPTKRAYMEEMEQLLPQLGTQAREVAKQAMLAYLPAIERLQAASGGK